MLDREFSVSGVGLSGENYVRSYFSDGLRKARVKVRYVSLRILHLGLLKWGRLSSGKWFGMYCYKNMELVRDVVGDLNSIIEPLEGYYRGLDELYSRFGIKYHEEDKLSPAGLKQLNLARQDYDERYGSILEREGELREAYDKKLSEYVEFDIYPMSYRGFPDSMSAMDIEQFRLLIEELSHEDYLSCLDDNDVSSFGDIGSDAGSGAVVGVGADGDIECVQDGGSRVERDN